MSTIDTRKFTNMMEQAGYQTGVIDNSATVGGGTGSGNGADTGSGETTTNVGNLNSATGTLDEVYAILQSYMKKSHFEDQTGLANTSTYIKAHLKDKMMSVPNNSRMLPGSEPVLKEVAKVISKMYDRVDRITFSGHTAGVGPYTLSDNQTS